MPPFSEYIQQLSNSLRVSGYEDPVLEAVDTILTSHWIQPFCEQYHQFQTLCLY